MDFSFRPARPYTESDFVSHEEWLAFKATQQAQEQQLANNNSGSRHYNSNSNSNSSHNIAAGVGGDAPGGYGEHRGSPPRRVPPLNASQSSAMLRNGGGGATAADPRHVSSTASFSSPRKRRTAQQAMSVSSATLPTSNTSAAIISSEYDDAIGRHHASRATLVPHAQYHPAYRVVSEGRLRNEKWDAAQEEWEDTGYWPNCESHHEKWLAEQRVAEKKRQEAEKLRIARAREHDELSAMGFGGLYGDSVVQQAERRAAEAEVLAQRAAARRERDFLLGVTSSSSGSVVEGADSTDNASAAVTVSKSAKPVVPPLPHDLFVTDQYNAVQATDRYLPDTFHEVLDYLTQDGGHLFETSVSGVHVVPGDVMRLFVNGKAGTATLHCLQELDTDGCVFSSFDDLIVAVQQKHAADEALVADILFYLVGPLCCIFADSAHPTPALPNAACVQQLLKDTKSGYHTVYYLQELDRQKWRCDDFAHELVPKIAQMHQDHLAAKANVLALLNGKKKDETSGGSDKSNAVSLFSPSSNSAGGDAAVSVAEVHNIFSSAGAGVATETHLHKLQTHRMQFSRDHLDELSGAVAALHTESLRLRKEVGEYMNMKFKPVSARGGATGDGGSDDDDNGDGDDDDNGNGKFKNVKLCDLFSFSSPLCREPITVPDIDLIFNAGRAHEATLRHLMTFNAHNRKFTTAEAVANAVRVAEDEERAQREKVEAFLLHPGNAQFFKAHLNQKQQKQNGDATDDIDIDQPHEEIDPAFICRLYAEGGMGMATFDIIKDLRKSGRHCSSHAELIHAVKSSAGELLRARDVAAALNLQKGTANRITTEWNELYAGVEVGHNGGLLHLVQGLSDVDSNTVNADGTVGVQPVKPVTIAQVQQWCSALDFKASDFLCALRQLDADDYAFTNSADLLSTLRAKLGMNSQNPHIGAALSLTVSCKSLPRCFPLVVVYERVVLKKSKHTKKSNFDYKGNLKSEMASRNDEHEFGLDEYEPDDGIGWVYAGQTERVAGNKDTPTSSSSSSTAIGITLDASSFVSSPHFSRRIQVTTLPPSLTQPHAVKEEMLQKQLQASKNAAAAGNVNTINVVDEGGATTPQTRTGVDNKPIADVIDIPGGEFSPPISQLVRAPSFDESAPNVGRSLSVQTAASATSAASAPSGHEPSSSVAGLLARMSDKSACAKELKICVFDADSNGWYSNDDLIGEARIYVHTLLEVTKRTRAPVTLPLSLPGNTRFTSPFKPEDPDEQESSQRGQRRNASQRHSSQHRANNTGVVVRGTDGGASTVIISPYIIGHSLHVSGVIDTAAPGQAVDNDILVDVIGSVVDNQQQQPQDPSLSISLRGGDEPAFSAAAAAAGSKISEVSLTSSPAAATAASAASATSCDFANVHMMLAASRLPADMYADPTTELTDSSSSEEEDNEEEPDPQDPVNEEGEYLDADGNVMTALAVAQRDKMRALKLQEKRDMAKARALLGKSKKEKKARAKAMALANQRAIRIGPDSLIVVSLLGYQPRVDVAGKQACYIDETEISENSLEPKYKKRIVVPHYAQSATARHPSAMTYPRVQFDLYDVSNAKPPVHSADSSGIDNRKRPDMTSAYGLKIGSTSMPMKELVDNHYRPARAESSASSVSTSSDSVSRKPNPDGKWETFELPLHIAVADIVHAQSQAAKDSGTRLGSLAAVVSELVKSAKIDKTKMARLEEAAAEATLEITMKVEGLSMREKSDVLANLSAANKYFTAGARIEGSISLRDVESLLTVGEGFQDKSIARFAGSVASDKAAAVGDDSAMTMGAGTASAGDGMNNGGNNMALMAMDALDLNVNDMDCIDADSGVVDDIVDSNLDDDVYDDDDDDAAVVGDHSMLSLGDVKSKKMTRKEKLRAKRKQERLVATMQMLELDPFTYGDITSYLDTFTTSGRKFESMQALRDAMIELHRKQHVLNILKSNAVAAPHKGAVLDETTHKLFHTAATAGIPPSQELLYKPTTAANLTLDDVEGLLDGRWAVCVPEDTDQHLSVAELTGMLAKFKQDGAKFHSVQEMGEAVSQALLKASHPALYDKLLHQGPSSCVLRVRGRNMRNEMTEDQNSDSFDDFSNYADGDSDVADARERRALAYEQQLWSLICAAVSRNQLQNSSGGSTSSTTKSTTTDASDKSDESSSFLGRLLGTSKRTLGCAVAVYARERDPVTNETTFVLCDQTEIVQHDYQPQFNKPLTVARANGIENKHLRIVVTINEDFFDRNLSASMHPTLASHARSASSASHAVPQDFNSLVLTDEEQARVSSYPYQHKRGGDCSDPTGVAYGALDVKLSDLLRFSQPLATSSATLGLDGALSEVGGLSSSNLRAHDAGSSNAFADMPSTYLLQRTNPSGFYYPSSCPINRVTSIDETDLYAQRQITHVGNDQCMPISTGYLHAAKNAAFNSHSTQSSEALALFDSHLSPQIDIACTEVLTWILKEKEAEAEAERQRLLAIREDAIAARRAREEAEAERFRLQKAAEDREIAARMRAMEENMRANRELANREMIEKERNAKVEEALTRGASEVYGGSNKALKDDHTGDTLLKVKSVDTATEQERSGQQSTMALLRAHRKALDQAATNMDICEDDNITFNLSCAALPKNDLMSKSDPVVALYVCVLDSDDEDESDDDTIIAADASEGKVAISDAGKSGSNRKFQYVGQTEVQKNTHYPSFKTPVPFEMKLSSDLLKRGAERARAAAAAQRKAKAAARLASTTAKAEKAAKKARKLDRAAKRAAATARGEDTGPKPPVFTTVAAWLEKGYVVEPHPGQETADLNDSDPEYESLAQLVSVFHEDGVETLEDVFELTFSDVDEMLENEETEPEVIMSMIERLKRDIAEEKVRKAEEAEDAESSSDSDSSTSDSDSDSDTTSSDDDEAQEENDGRPSNLDTKKILLKFVVYDADDDQRVTMEDALGSLEVSLARLYTSMMDQFHDHDQDYYRRRARGKGAGEDSDGDGDGNGDGDDDAADADKAHGEVVAEGVCTHPLTDALGKFVTGIVEEEHERENERVLTSERRGKKDRSTITVSMTARAAKKVVILSPEEIAYNTMRDRIKAFLNDDGRKLWMREQRNHPKYDGLDEDEKDTLIQQSALDDGGMPDIMDPSSTPLTNADVDRLFDEGGAGRGTYMVLRALENDPDYNRSIKSVDELIATVQDYTRRMQEARAAVKAFLSSGDCVMFEDPKSSKKKKKKGKKQSGLGEDTDSGDESDGDSRSTNNKISDSAVGQLFAQGRAGFSTLAHIKQINALLNRTQTDEANKVKVRVKGDKGSDGSGALALVLGDSGDDAGSGLSLREKFRAGPTDTKLVAEIKSMNLRAQIDREEVYEFLNDRDITPELVRQTTLATPSRATSSHAGERTVKINPEEQMCVDGTVCTLFDDDDTRVSMAQVNQIFDECESNIFTLDYLRNLCRTGRQFDFQTSSADAAADSDKVDVISTRGRKLHADDLSELIEAVKAEHEESLHHRTLVLRHLRAQRPRLKNGNLGVVGPFARHVGIADVDALFYLSKAGSSTLGYLQQADRLALSIYEPFSVDGDIVQRAWGDIKEVTAFVTQFHQQSLLDRYYTFKLIGTMHNNYLARKARKAAQRSQEGLPVDDKDDDDEQPQEGNDVKMSNVIGEDGDGENNTKVDVTRLRQLLAVNRTYDVLSYSTASGDDFFLGDIDTMLINSKANDSLIMYVHACQDDMRTYDSFDGLGGDLTAQEPISLTHRQEVLEFLIRDMGGVVGGDAPVSGNGSGGADKKKTASKNIGLLGPCPLSENGITRTFVDQLFIQTEAGAATLRHLKTLSRWGRQYKTTALLIEAVLMMQLDEQLQIKRINEWFNERRRTGIAGASVAIDSSAGGAAQKKSSKGSHRTSRRKASKDAENRNRSKSDATGDGAANNTSVGEHDISHLSPIDSHTVKNTLRRRQQALITSLFDSTQVTGGCKYMMAYLKEQAEDEANAPPITSTSSALAYTRVLGTYEAKETKLHEQLLAAPKAQLAAMRSADHFRIGSDALGEVRTVKGKDVTGAAPRHVFNLRGKMKDINTFWLQQRDVMLQRCKQEDAPVIFDKAKVKHIRKTIGFEHIDKIYEAAGCGNETVRYFSLIEDDCVAHKDHRLQEIYHLIPALQAQTRVAGNHRQHVLNFVNDPHRCMLFPLPLTEEDRAAIVADGGNPDEEDEDIREFMMANVDTLMEKSQADASVLPHLRYLQQVEAREFGVGVDDGEEGNATAMQACADEVAAIQAKYPSVCQALADYMNEPGPPKGNGGRGVHLVKTTNSAGKTLVLKCTPQQMLQMMEESGTGIACQRYLKNLALKHKQGEDLNDLTELLKHELTADVEMQRKILAYLKQPYTGGNDDGKSLHRNCDLIGNADIKNKLKRADVRKLTLDAGPETLKCVQLLNAAGYVYSSDDPIAELAAAVKRTHETIERLTNESSGHLQTRLGNRLFNENESTDKKEVKKAAAKAKAQKNMTDYEKQAANEQEEILNFSRRRGVKVYPYMLNKLVNLDPSITTSIPAYCDEFNDKVRRFDPPPSNALYDAVEQENRTALLSSVVQIQDTNDENNKLLLGVKRTPVPANAAVPQSHPFGKREAHRLMWESGAGPFAREYIAALIKQGRQFDSAQALIDAVSEMHRNMLEQRDAYLKSMCEFMAGGGGEELFREKVRDDIKFEREAAVRAFEQAHFQTADTLKEMLKAKKHFSSISSLIDGVRQWVYDKEHPVLKKVRAQYVKIKPDNLKPVTAKNLTTQQKDRVKDVLDEWLEIELYASDIPHMGGKVYTTDPYLVIRRNRMEKFLALDPPCRTETHFDSYGKLQFRPLIVRQANLCYSDPTRTIQFQIMDHNETTNRLSTDVVIGTHELTVMDLFKHGNSKRKAKLPLLSAPSENGHDKGGKRVGDVIVQQAQRVLDITSGIKELKPSRLFVDNPKMIVKLLMAGVKLPKMDTLGKTDAYVEILTLVNDDWDLVYRTEVVYHNLNPVWLPAVLDITAVCQGYFDRPLLIRVWDHDKHSDDDIVGQFATSLKKIMQTPKKKNALVQEDDDDRILADAIAENRACRKRDYELMAQLADGTDTWEEEQDVKPEYFTLKISGEKLDKMDTFGKADPYIQVYRHRNDHWQLVAKTETQKKTLNPSWDPLVIDVRKLTSSTAKRPIEEKNKDRVLFKLWDWDKANAPDFMGSYETTIGGIRQLEGKRVEVYNEAKAEKVGKKYVNSGHLHFTTVLITKSLDVHLQAMAKERHEKALQNAGAIMFKQAQLLIDVTELDSQVDAALESPVIEYENWGYDDMSLKRAAFIEFLNPSDKNNCLQYLNQPTKAKAAAALRKEAEKQSKMLKKAADKSTSVLDGSQRASSKKKKVDDGRVLKKKKTKGGLTEEAKLAELKTAAENEIVEFIFTGKGLPKMDTFGKCDPFLEIFRHVKGEWQLIAKTEVVRNTLNPVFPPLGVKVKRLLSDSSRGDHPLVMKVFDWDKGSAPDYIGEFSTTLAEVRSASNMEFELIDAELKKKKGKKYKNSGVITLVSARNQADKQLTEEEQMALSGSVTKRARSTANVK